MKESIEQTVHYCKFDKKAGVPIHVTDATGSVEKTNYWTSGNLIEESTGRRIKYVIKFNNATGKAKASGATSILQKIIL